MWQLKREGERVTYTERRGVTDTEGRCCDRDRGKGRGVTDTRGDGKCYMARSEGREEG